MMRSLTLGARMYVLWPGLALVWLSACASHVVLRRPPATDTGSLGPFQRCSSPERPCVDDERYDSSRLNAAHTRFFQLPRCAYGIHDILIHDSGSADAEVLVRCAAPGPDPAALQPGGLPVTAAGGGTIAGAQRASE